MESRKVYYVLLWNEGSREQIVAGVFGDEKEVYDLIEKHVDVRKVRVEDFTVVYGTELTISKGIMLREGVIMFWVIYGNEIMESFLTLREARRYIKSEGIDGDWWIISGESYRKV